MQRLDAILQKAAVDGGVDYDAACSDPALAAALDEVATTRLEELPGRDHRVAFIINAYNVAAVGLACRRWGNKGFRSRGVASMMARARFFFIDRVRVARRRTTLAWLEYVTLRRETRDPRVHAALVCATGSCPPLRGGRYHGEDLDRELDLAMTAFVRAPGGAVLDRTEGTLTLNRIFKWYAGDFKRSGGVRSFVAHYLDGDDAAWVQAHNPRVRFARYDWRPNHRASNKKAAPAS